VGDPLVTSVVGSHPQPGWLIDRERLGDRLTVGTSRIPLYVDVT
jgi:hypothetical protein